MKKLCTFLLALTFSFTCLFSNIVAYAEGKDGVVKVTVDGADDNGQVKEGQDIEIKVELNDMDRLYTALLDFYYDKDLLKLEEPVVNEELLGNSRFELPSYVSGTKVRYGFTYLNDTEGYGATGFTGSSSFVSIKGKALKDGKIDLSKDKVKASLVRRVDAGDVESINYKLETPQGTEDVTGSEVTVDMNETLPDEENDDRFDMVDRTSSENQQEIVQKLKENSSNNSENEDNNSETNSESNSDNNGTSSSNDEDKLDNSDNDDSNSNKTSNDEKTDNTVIYLVLGLAVVAAVVIGGVVVYKKKKSSNN